MTIAESENSLNHNVAGNDVSDYDKKIVVYVCGICWLLLLKEEEEVFIIPFF